MVNSESYQTLIENENLVFHAQAHPHIIIAKLRQPRAIESASKITGFSYQDAWMAQGIAMADKMPQPFMSCFIFLVEYSHVCNIFIMYFY
ncbi:MAG: hypothetical protein LBF51_09275, partial [Zoogloeaceae bacterium]|nr:hypothetical protein [Zoogloeaceae bacterium]